MGKPSPCLKIRVENCKKIKDSDERKIMVVRKWINPNTLNELRSCMGFVVYTRILW